MEVNDEDGMKMRMKMNVGGVCEVGWFRVNNILLLRLMRLMMF